MNYATSEGPAQEVVQQIKDLGGDAIAVGADISKKEDIDRSAYRQVSMFNSRQSPGRKI